MSSRSCLPLRVASMRIGGAAAGNECGTKACTASRAESRPRHPAIRESVTAESAKVKPRAGLFWLHVLPIPLRRHVYAKIVIEQLSCFVRSWVVQPHDAGRSDPD